MIYADNGESGSVTRGEACYGGVGGVTEEYQRERDSRLKLFIVWPLTHTTGFVSFPHEGSHTIPL